MNRVERLEEALQTAQAFICVMKKSVGLSSGRIQELALEAQGKISTVLAPPPAYEDVEVVRWAIVRGNGEVASIQTSDTRPSALSPGCTSVKLTGTYKRPIPSPVEKMTHGIAADGSVVLDIGEQPKPGTRCVVMWEAGGEETVSPVRRSVVVHNVYIEQSGGNRCNFDIIVQGQPEDMTKNAALRDSLHGAQGDLTFTFKEDQ